MSDAHRLNCVSDFYASKARLIGSYAENDDCQMPLAMREKAIFYLKLAAQIQEDAAEETNEPFNKGNYCVRAVSLNLEAQQETKARELIAKYLGYQISESNIAELNTILRLI